ncbi:MAG: helix-turn-helix domain-containing protein [Dehalococcoidia bacterium]|nr:helix-turn-helix domain-containing protein [Dehalococcoidia bacterium]
MIEPNGATALRTLDLWRQGFRDMEIAATLGVSRQRVHQIRRRLGLPARTDRVSLTCDTCGKPLVRNKGAVYRHNYCSRKCYHPDQPVLTCEICGKQFGRKKSAIHVHNFCSRKCSGSWAGQQFGFKAHPENQWGNRGMAPGATGGGGRR